MLRRRGALAIAMAVLTAAVAALVARAGIAQAESNGGVRLMPLGDSITDGFNIPGGYRVGLWQRLVSGGYTVDFVGPQSNGPATLGDHDHAGFTGWEISQIDANIVSWLTTYTPRTVMLQIGTNDILHNIDIPNAPTRLGALIDKITSTAPSAEVFVASITPLASASDEAKVATFNSAVPGLIATRANAGRHVHFVNMHDALTAADLADGIHPNQTGYDKMAATWYAALRSVPASLTSTTPTTAPPTTTRPPTSAPPTTSRPPTSAPPTTSRPPTSAPAGKCTATYVITGQWPGGFQGAVTVTAGGSAITSWTVTWTFANGQTVTSFWSATITASGAAVTARNVSYNGSVGAGGNVQFGFLGTWNGTNGIPALTCSAA